PPSPRRTPFPYTTLFRSHGLVLGVGAPRDGGLAVPRGALPAGSAAALTRPLRRRAWASVETRARGTLAVPRRDRRAGLGAGRYRSEEHTSELQSLAYLVC